MLSMSPSPKTTQTIDYITNLKPNKKQWSAVGGGGGGSELRPLTITNVSRRVPDWSGSVLLDPVLFSNEISIGIM